MKYVALFAAAALVLSVSAPAAATTQFFVETFDGSNIADGSGCGTVFIPTLGGLDNTGWTGDTTFLSGLGISACGGQCSMIVGDPISGGAHEGSLWRTIGSGDDMVAHLDATRDSDGLQAIKGTTFSWIFRDDVNNSFRVGIDVVDYDDIRLQVEREKGGSLLSLLDVNMTDYGLGDAPDLPVGNDIHEMRLDWTVTWDQVNTEWGFLGTVTLENDDGSQTLGSYTQSLVMTTDYDASEPGREMKLLQQYDGNAVNSDGYTISASAIGLNEVSVVPEPLTMLGVGMGVAGLAGYVRRRKLA